MCGPAAWPAVSAALLASKQVGGEVVELDADTVAPIEALQGDVNAGRVDGALLQPDRGRTPPHVAS